MAPHWTWMIRLRFRRWMIRGIRKAAAPARRMGVRKDKGK
jgi:hypothetical protein